jgi:hypothetical protein
MWDVLPVTGLHCSVLFTLSAVKRYTLLPSWHDSERKISFRVRGGSVVKGTQVLIISHRKQEVNWTRKAATTSELLSQRGNIALTSDCLWREECCTALITHDLQQLFSLQIFFLFYTWEFDYDPGFMVQLISKFFNKWIDVYVKYVRDEEWVLCHLGLTCPQVAEG